MSRIYIGRLSNSASRYDVERFLRGYGKVNEVVMMKNYAFVELDDSRDADDAIYELNGKNLAGSRVVVERTRLPPRFNRSRQRSPPRRPPPLKRFRGPKFGPPQRTDHRIIVDNLSSRISWQDLKDIMRKVGDVTFAGAHMTKRNEGVVEFSSSSDMRRAIDKYDGYVLYGRKLRVFQDRERRSSSRSPSRSPSRSRRRHRSRKRSHRDRKERSRSRSSQRSSSGHGDSPKRQRRDSGSPDTQSIKSSGASERRDSNPSREASPDVKVKEAEPSEVKSNERRDSDRRYTDFSSPSRSGSVDEGNEKNRAQSDNNSNHSSS